jgi:hypothetical protein
VVPIFVAVMVLLIRVLIIGTISLAGDRLFSQDTVRKSSRRTQLTRQTNRRSEGQSTQHAIRPLTNTRSASIRRGVSASSYRPSPKPETPYSRESQSVQEPEYIPMEPTYSPVSMSTNRDSSRSRQNRF